MLATSENRRDVCIQHTLEIVHVQLVQWLLGTSNSSILIEVSFFSAGAVRKLGMGFVTDVEQQIESS